MYNDKRHVLQLIALLKQFDIMHIVVSPGNRNIPIVHSVENDPYFKVYSILDERSSGFFALGLIQDIKKPVAICCTSGTAVLNYSSSVAEAFYQKLPLLIITTDRPYKYLGQYEDQMIQQRCVFGGMVKKYVEIEEIKSKDDDWYCNRVINEALLELMHRGYGPVHINVILWGELTRFTVKNLPDVRKIQRFVHPFTCNDFVDIATDIIRYEKKMIVFGQSLPFNNDEYEIIKNFVERLGFIVIVNNFSNYTGTNVVNNAATILNNESEYTCNELVPDLVITIKGHVLKGIKEFLRKYQIKENWYVDESGEVVDQYMRLTRIYECRFLYFMSSLILDLDKEFYSIKKNQFIEKWVMLSEKYKNKKVDKFSDLYAVSILMKKIPHSSVLHLANSSSVRLSQYFDIDSSVKIYCNRGTNGIDGSLSSAIGCSVVNDKLTFILIGDLSFLYDINGICNKYIGNNVRILLNNNFGAGIFYYNVGKKKVNTIDKHIGYSHSVSAKVFAEGFGFDYMSACDIDELEKNIEIFISDKTEKPILFEVFTDKEKDAEVLKDYAGKKSDIERIIDKMFVLGKNSLSRVK